MMNGDSASLLNQKRKLEVCLYLYIYIPTTLPPQKMPRELNHGICRL